MVIELKFEDWKKCYKFIKLLFKTTPSQLRRWREDHSIRRSDADWQSTEKAWSLDGRAPLPPGAPPTPPARPVCHKTVTGGRG